MRLRLTVQRNALPDANILWSVPDTANPQTYTITRLLEDVNLIIPLEAEHWGLEHYVVELGGFECLHFSPVAQALKEDDHVSIRPLVKAEVRARTLTGRHQISNGGQHLIDGVPFGRPLLREPKRPDVRIPPRKRRRLDDADEETDEGDKYSRSQEMRSMMEEVEKAISGESSARPAIENAPRLSAGEKKLSFLRDLATAMEMTGDLPEGNLSGSPSRPPSSNEEMASLMEDIGLAMEMTRNFAPTSGSGRASRPPPKTVQFKQPELELLDDDSDEDDDDDDDFAPSEGYDEDVDEEGHSDSDSGLDSDRETNPETGLANASDSTSDSDSDDSSDSDSDSDSGESSGPEVMSSKGVLQNYKPTAVPKSPVHVPPGAGKKATQSRNARRTMANRLRLLKASGELPKDATLKDLTKYEEEKRHGYVEEEPQPANGFGHHAGKRKRIDDEETTTDSAAELERRKQELMAKFAGEAASETTQENQPTQTAVVETENSPNEAASEDQVMQEPSSEPQEKDSTEKEPAPEAKATRRLRPDTTAIGRILARQARSVVKKPAKAKAPTPEPEGASDPEFWKTRINLSAFECWDEEFELSAPPFPFKQHWDPAGKLMREKANKKKQKRNKKAAPVEEVVEEEEDEEERIFLNYDDGPDAENPDAEISAAIDDQLQQDIVVAAQSDLPPLPEDVSILPELTSADIKVGAVIVCKFFAVNPITVTPEISGFKTATVEKEGDSGNGAGTIRLRIAERDLPKREKKFDSKGNRVYDAADGFFMDEEDEGLWDGVFSELLEPKLLQAA